MVVVVAEVVVIELVATVVVEWGPAIRSNIYFPVTKLSVTTWWNRGMTIYLEIISADLSTCSTQTAYKREIDFIHYYQEVVKLHWLGGHSRHNETYDCLFFKIFEFFKTGF